MLRIEERLNNTNLISTIACDRRSPATVDESLRVQSPDIELKNPQLESLVRKHVTICPSICERALPCFACTLTPQQPRSAPILRSSVMHLHHLSASMRM